MLGRLKPEHEFFIHVHTNENHNFNEAELIKKIKRMTMLDVLAAVYWMSDWATGNGSERATNKAMTRIECYLACVEFILATEYPDKPLAIMPRDQIRAALQSQDPRSKRLFSLDGDQPMISCLVEVNSNRRIGTIWTKAKKAGFSLGAIICPDMVDRRDYPVSLKTTFPKACLCLASPGGPSVTIYPAEAEQALAAYPQKLLEKGCIPKITDLEAMKAFLQGLKNKEIVKVVHPTTPTLMLPSTTTPVAIASSSRASSSASSSSTSSSVTPVKRNQPVGSALPPDTKRQCLFMPMTAPMPSIPAQPSSSRVSHTLVLRNTPTHSSSTSTVTSILSPSPQRAMVQPPLLIEQNVTAVTNGAHAATGLECQLLAVTEAVLSAIRRVRDYPYYTCDRTSCDKVRDQIQAMMNNLGSYTTLIANRRDTGIVPFNHLKLLAELMQHIDHVVSRLNLISELTNRIASALTENLQQAPIIEMEFANKAINREGLRQRRSDLSQQGDTFLSENFGILNDIEKELSAIAARLFAYLSAISGPVRDLNALHSRDERITAHGGALVALLGANLKALQEAVSQSRLASLRCWESCNNQLAQRSQLPVVQPTSKQSSTCLSDSERAASLALFALWQQTPSTQQTATNDGVRVIPSPPPSAGRGM